MPWSMRSARSRKNRPRRRLEKYPGLWADRCHEVGTMAVNGRKRRDAAVRNRFCAALPADVVGLCRQSLSPSCQPAPNTPTRRSPRHGLVWNGGWLALFRVMRCGPGGTPTASGQRAGRGCLRLEPTLVGAVAVDWRASLLRQSIDPAIETDRNTLPFCATSAASWASSANCWTSQMHSNHPRSYAGLDKGEHRWRKPFP